MSAIKRRASSSRAAPSTGTSATITDWYSRGDLDVVVLAARAAHSAFEVEPHRAGARTDYRDRPALDLDDTAGPRVGVGEGGE